MTITVKRILVTGSRDRNDRGVMRAVLTALWAAPEYRDAVLVHGACPTGADEICRQEWERLGGTTEPHPAQWDVHGKAAGPIRNQQMVDLGADVCLAFPLPNSRGTVDCMGRAGAAGIPVVQL